MDVSEDLAELIEYAIAHNLIEVGDARWAYNAILERIGQNGPAPVFPALSAGSFELQTCLDHLVEAARAQNVPAAQGDGQQLATSIMGTLMPRPAYIARHFDELLAQDPQAATDYFYRLCGDADYIRRAAIARDIKWTAQTEWGALEITINLSKPEKDPRAIAKAASAPQGGERYPACQLCMENEGYAGRLPDDPDGFHPARQNLRIVPLTLEGQRWGLQYSPYAYYAEHCIVMNEQHIPMHIGRGCFERLLAFVDLIPHYFVGSNADLPIVGGSILSHDHFQGGAHVFPMDRTHVEQAFELPGLPNVKAGILHWPLTVVRLESENRAELLDAAETVLQTWIDYDDPAVGIVSRSEGVRHNTITPIARKQGSVYVLNLALRCNVTSPEHPLGIFHPHEELHHIKKENIGLIEVMGLAILPPRLERELSAVALKLAAGLDLKSDPLCAPHAAWAYDVARRRPELNEFNVRRILHDEVGLVFARVLEQAGVFKWDRAGRDALNRFLASVANRL